MDKDFTQQEWNQLIEKYPPGTPMTGEVSDRQGYGDWVTLDELPDVPALLEVIHFEVIETRPDHRIEFPDDFPTIGTPLEVRVLGWRETPEYVRLTQLSHLDWSHQRFKEHPS